MGVEGMQVLRSRLEDICDRRGGVAFGIASVDQADALPRVKIGYTYNRYTKPLRSGMPEARSVIIYGVPSVDDSDELAVERSPDKWTYPGYFPLNMIARDIIRELRGFGYKAAYPSELASHKRLAILAGIGAYGKNSLVISPRHGPWLRFGVVVTDAELPVDKPFTKDLCGRCRRCVSACPAGALKPYEVDADRCIVGASIRTKVPPSMMDLIRENEPRLTPKTHVMCTKCQLVCPYTSSQRRRNVVHAPVAARPKSRGKRKRV